MNDQEVFFNRVGSICTHAEEYIGTYLFNRITFYKDRINPSLTFLSTVVYINSRGKLKIHRDFPFQVFALIKDEWIDNFINGFHVFKPDCNMIVRVLTKDRNLEWYIQFVTSVFGIQFIERDGQRIVF